MNGWAVAGFAVTVFACWVGVETLAERRRQQRWAEKREPIDETGFAKEMVAGGVAEDTARWMWRRVQPYYFRPLTPHASDRPCSEFRIDGDDIVDWLRDYERDFEVELHPSEGKWPIDPTYVELAVAIESARVPLT